MDIGLLPEPVFDELKRPGGTYEKTAEPVFIRAVEDRGQKAESGGTVTLACATPGASIAWRIGGEAKGNTGWELYVKPARRSKRSCTPRPAESVFATAKSTFCWGSVRQTGDNDEALARRSRRPPAAALRRC
jgi:hypothetical protein